MDPPSTTRQGSLDSRYFIGALLLAVVAATWPSAVFLAGKWRIDLENMLAHGWVLVALACWEIFRAGANASVRSAPAVAILVCLATGLLWAVLFAADTASIAAGLALVLFASGLWALYGSFALIRYSRALFLLALALPFWDIFLQPLWSASVFVCTHVVQLLGVSIFVNGNVVELGSGNIVIAAGCAGISFFVSSITLAAILGHLNQVNLRTQIIMLVVAGLGAMVFNWIRIVALILIGYYSQMQSPLLFDHGAFGWSLFALWIFTFILLVTRLLPNHVPESPIAQQAGNPSPQRLTATLAALLVFPLWVHGASLLTGKHEVRADGGIASIYGVPWAPAFENADIVSMRAAKSADGKLFVYEARYLTQRQSKELFGANNTILGSFSLVKTETPENDSYQDLFAQDRLGGYWLLRYAYAVGEELTSDQLRIRLALVKRRFVGHSDAAVIALARACGRLQCDTVDRTLVTTVWQQLIQGRAQ